jgi:hypothetical protein
MESEDENPAMTEVHNSCISLENVQPLCISFLCTLESFAREGVSFGKSVSLMR